MDAAAATAMPNLNEPAPLPVNVDSFDPLPYPSSQRAPEKKVFHPNTYEPVPRVFDPPRASQHSVEKPITRDFLPPRGPQSDLVAPSDQLVSNQRSPVKLAHSHFYQESIGGEIWSMLQEGLSDWDMSQVDSQPMLPL